MTPPPRPAFDEALEAVKLALQLCPACGGAGGFPEQVGDEEWGERQCECGAITVPIEAALPTLASEHAALREEATGFKTAWENELLLRGEADAKLGAANHDGYMQRCRGDVHRDEAAALRAEVERLRTAGEALMAGMDEVAPAISGAFAFQQLHGSKYEGRTIEDEIAAFRAALAPSPKEADGLSAEERGRRKPPSPETLVDALQDRMHTEAGRGRAARTVRGESDADTQED